MSHRHSDDHVYTGCDRFGAQLMHPCCSGLRAMSILPTYIRVLCLMHWLADLVEGLMENAEGLGEEALAVHRVLEGHRHRLEELAGKPHTYAQLLEVQVRRGNVLF